MAKKHTKIRTSFSDHVINFITYVVYSFFAFVCVYPFYYIAINSISNNDLSQRGKVILYPMEVHFTNYVQVFQLKGLLTAARVSVERTLIGTVLTVVVAAFLGYMFTRKTLWLGPVWRKLVMATMYLTPGIIPQYIIYSNIGLRNNFWVYILPVIIQPFYILLCKTYVESVPMELQEAAEIDGAGTLTVFFRIMIPVIKPILATIAIFAAVAQWNSFQDTLLFVTNDKLNTLQFTLYRYIQSASSLKSLISSTANASSIAASLATSQNQTSVRMTVTMVVVIPIILVYPFFQRYFTKGIMIGAVKG